MHCLLLGAYTQTRSFTTLHNTALLLAHWALLNKIRCLCFYLSHRLLYCQFALAAAICILCYPLSVVAIAAVIVNLLRQHYALHAYHLHCILLFNNNNKKWGQYIGCCGFCVPAFGQLTANAFLCMCMREFACICFCKRVLLVLALARSLFSLLFFFNKQLAYVALSEGVQ